jgi:ankyrin repeat protein
MGQLKKQAKELLALYRQGDPAAMQRFRESLPAARGKPDEALATLALRLHDAQSSLAREYGFSSWSELQLFVHARRALADDPAQAMRRWLLMVYAGDVAGGNHSHRPAVAARLLDENSALPGDDPYLACTVGDEDALRRATARDPAWVHREGGPLRLPPLVAVTHSGLAKHPSFRERLRDCAKFLLGAGASPNQSIGSRWPPATLAAPSSTERLSALYGAAGKALDPELTRLLLEAGADPNDGESLYHSLEAPACTQLLLNAGARIDGTNAMYRALDLDNAGVLQMLLDHGGDPNEPPLGPPTSEWGSPLMWAIRRRRSLGHIQALLAAGAKADVCTPDGVHARTLALRFGRPDVATLLGHADTEQEPLAAEEAFVLACARGDLASARAIQMAHPGVIDALDDARLRLLPELAEQGCSDAVKAMVSCGWPLEIRGGDIDATALNQAIFRGDAELTHFLMAHGADWRTLHGYGDNACGSLSWASLNEPVHGGDWAGCARALVAHGLPPARPDPGGADIVWIGERRYQFADDVTDVLLGVD